MYKTIKLAKISLVLTLAGIMTMIALSPVAFASNYPGIQGRIVFTSNRDGNDEIYIMNPNGAFQQNLTNSPSTDDYEAAVSPDGTKIAYASGPAGGGGVVNIWVMDADGSNKQPLTTEVIANRDSYEPDWSPDGTRIAFSTRLAGGSNLQLYTMNADGSNKALLTSGSGESVQNPSWSPDGSRIAYVNFIASIADVWVVDADGNNPDQLTTNPVNSETEFPNWSPDGNRIVYDNDPTQTTRNIYIMDADGSNQTPLTSTYFAYRAVWSPDGTKIVFTQFTAMGQPEDVWSMNPDGSGLVRLTNAPFGITHNGSEPYWSIITPLVVPPPLGGPPGVPSDGSNPDGQGNPSNTPPGLAPTGENTIYYLLLSVGLLAAGLFTIRRSLEK